MKKQLLTFTLTCAALIGKDLHAGPLTDAIKSRSFKEARNILQKNDGVLAGIEDVYDLLDAAIVHIDPIENEVNATKNFTQEECDELFRKIVENITIIDPEVINSGKDEYSLSFLMSATNLQDIPKIKILLEHGAKLLLKPEDFMFVGRDPLYTTIIDAGKKADQATTEEEALEIRKNALGIVDLLLSHGDLNFDYYQKYAQNIMIRDYFFQDASDEFQALFTDESLKNFQEISAMNKRVTERRLKPLTHFKELKDNGQFSNFLVERQMTGGYGKQFGLKYKAVPDKILHRSIKE